MGLERNGRVIREMYENAFYGMNNFWSGGGSVVFNSNLGIFGERVIDAQRGVQDAVSQQAVIPLLHLPVSSPVETSHSACL